jgi:hypothetical protein
MVLGQLVIKAAENNRRLVAIAACDQPLDAIRCVRVVHE